MELVKFIRGNDPKKQMDIGKTFIIKQWFEKWAPHSKYRIDDDDAVIVYNDLDISDSEVKEIPFNELIVRCKMDIQNTAIEKLPKLRVFEKLEISNSNIKELPKGLWVKDLVMSFTKKLKVLPDDIKIEMNLVAKESELQNIHDNIDVGYAMNLSGSKVRTLSKGISLNGYLDISKTLINKIPGDIKIMGTLNITDTQINVDDIPESALIYGKIFKREKVNESIGFKRGIEPKDSMHIGMNALITYIIEEIEKKQKFEQWRHKTLNGKNEIEAIEKWQIGPKSFNEKYAHVPLIKDFFCNSYLIIDFVAKKYSGKISIYHPEIMNWKLTKDTVFGNLDRLDPNAIANDVDEIMEDDSFWMVMIDSVIKDAAMFLGLI